VRSQGRFARELLGKARAAFTDGRWEEAVRYCHQIRSEPRVPRRTLDEVWRILGLATAHSGRPKEAASYLRRAPLDDEIAEAWLQALAELEDDEGMHELLTSEDWKRLKNGDAIATRVANRTLG
jgi:hypothetical protein